MDFIKDNKKVISIALFAVIAIIAIVVLALVLKTPIVPVCVFIVIEALLAVLLHNAELWMHGVAVLVQIIAGIALGKIVIIIICVLVYIVATLALKFFTED